MILPSEYILCPIVCFSPNLNCKLWCFFTVAAEKIIWSVVDLVLGRIVWVVVSCRLELLPDAKANGSYNCARLRP
ncbi:hypothetical protein M3J09_013861 [Ascochyta lentis]